MRKSLTTLVRLQREKKEGCQRKFAQAQREVEQAAGVLARARSEMASEEALAASNLELANPHYLPRAQARVHELDARLAHLRREEEKSRADMLASLREEKTHEKLIERRSREEEKQATRREQKEEAQMFEAVRHNKAAAGKAAASKAAAGKAASRQGGSTE